VIGLLPPRNDNSQHQMSATQRTFFLIYPDINTTIPHNRKTFCFQKFILTKLIS